MGIFLFELCHAPLKAQLSPLAVLHCLSLGICFVRDVARATMLGRTRKECKSLSKLGFALETREQEATRLDTWKGREGKEFVALLTIFSYYF